MFCFLDTCFREQSKKDAQEKLQKAQLNTVEFFNRVGGATERYFGKMEVLKKFEGEEKNNAPDDVDGDDSHNNRDLFCEEVDEEDYDLCSGCNEKPIAHLLQPWGHTICSNCVTNKNSYKDVEYPLT